MARFWGEDEGDDHPHMEITQAVIGAAIRIQSSLGPGLLEDAYKVCLAHALRLDGHKVLREVYLDIEWEGLILSSAILCEISAPPRSNWILHTPIGFLRGVGGHEFPQ